MTPAHHQQHTWTHTEAGTYLVRAVCASAPAVVNDDTQDRPGNRAGFFLASKLLQLGRGLRAPGPFHQFPNPLTGVSSPLVRAGRQAVERMSYTCSGLPFHSRFKTTDHVACKLSDRSPATAHSLCLLRCNNHAAKGVVNVQEQVGGFRIV